MEKEMPQSFSKRRDISILRRVATIAVVFLHTNSTLTDNHELFQLTDKQFLFHLCAYRVLYWAIPVFIHFVYRVLKILLVRVDVYWLIMPVFAIFFLFCWINFNLIGL